MNNLRRLSSFKDEKVIIIHCVLYVITSSGQGQHKYKLISETNHDRKHLKLEMQENSYCRKMREFIKYLQAVAFMMHYPCFGQL